jgi:hypothetical protein
VGAPADEAEAEAGDAPGPRVPAASGTDVAAALRAIGRPVGLVATAIAIVAGLTLAIPWLVDRL